MAREWTETSCIRELRKAVKERKGKIDKFLLPQLMLTANVWALTIKMGRRLADADLVGLETGSMGQVKVIINPLLDKYFCAVRELRASFRALGINYDTTPKKVSEASADTEQDPLDAFLNGMADADDDRGQ